MRTMITMEKDSVLKAYKRAISDGRKQSRIALETGVAVDSLYQFNSGLGMGEDKIDAVAQWLSKNGYLSEEGDPLNDTMDLLRFTMSLVDDPAKARAQKARLLLDFLDIVSREFQDGIREIGAGREGGSIEPK